MTHLRQVSSTSTTAPLSWVESLFQRMEAMYGSKFLDMWRGADPAIVKALWAGEMGKLSREELKHGYAALMSQDWPPSLPAFVKLCKPTVEPLHAYYEAVNGVQARARGEIGKWSHPAVYWAAMPMSFDLSSQTYSQMKGRWEKAFADEMEKGEWEPIPQPMVALPAPGKADLSREKAAASLRNLGASGILSNTGRDQKRWARKLLQREAEGDKTLTPWQIKCAREALNQEAA